MTRQLLLLLLASLVSMCIGGSVLVAIRIARSPTFSPRARNVRAIGAAFFFSIPLSLTACAIMIFGHYLNLATIARAEAAGATITRQPTDSTGMDLVTIETPGQPPTKPIRFVSWTGIGDFGLKIQFFGTLFLFFLNVLVLSYVKPRPESRGFELPPQPSPTHPSSTGPPPPSPNPGPSGSTSSRLEEIP